MTYQQTLDYIFSKLPMFSKLGSKALKPGLDNISTLCSILHHPQTKLKCIHVAGTNGKGSVSHMLASILQSAGYKTGLYTSPHLHDFRERIKIDAIMIGEEEVIQFVEQMKPHIATIEPSFFEITVAMALDHFEKNKVDIAVIETGLGGRLDSTNIITPVLSVITNIGYDHVQILGDTLELIAAEKAGIIKSGVPVVIGEKQPETEPVFVDFAKTNQAPIVFAEDDYAVVGWQYSQQDLVVELSDKNRTDHKVYHLDLPAQYQTKNLLTVLASVKKLKEIGFSIEASAMVNGLKHVKKTTGLHGRWETILHHPRVVLDVAHNESGMKEMLNQLEVTSYHHLHLILGMVKDKDVEKLLSMLPKLATYYFTNAHIPRALPAEELRIKASEKQLDGLVFSNVNEAVKVARAHAHKDDLIVVCGSVFLVGEVDRS